MLPFRLVPRPIRVSGEKIAVGPLRRWTFIKGKTMKTIEETLGLELVTNEYLVRKLRERAADEEWTNGDEAEAERLRSRAAELEQNCSKVEWVI